MAFVVIPAATTQPNKPVDTYLLTTMVDNDNWLKALLESHNHDGTATTLVPVGPNALRNGGFEQGTTGWTLSAYTGGTLATNATNEAEGAACLGITSTVLANGGGVALSDEYVPVRGGAAYSLVGGVKASAAGVSARMEIVWYDDAKAPISATTVYDTASAPTSYQAEGHGGTVAAPSTAKFKRVRLTGGVPTVGASVGTVYFDGVLLTHVPLRAVAGSSTFTPWKVASPVSQTTAVFTEILNAKIVLSGVYRITWSATFVAGNPTSRVRIYKNGVAFGVEHSFNNSGTYNASEDLEFAAGDTIQFFSKSDVGGEVAFTRPLFGTAVPAMGAYDYYLGLR